MALREIFDARFVASYWWDLYSADSWFDYDQFATLTSGGITGTLGRADETDSVISVTAYHSYPSSLITAATGTDAAIGVGRRKSRTLGTATETDTGISLGRKKTKAVNRADETDAAISVAHVHTRVVGFGTETDTSPVPLAKRKTRSLGFPTETDSAISVTLYHSYPASLISPATGTDTAFGVGRRKIRALGTALETDTPFSVGRRKTKAVGFATETDQAIKLTVTLRYALETDTTFGLGKRKTRTLGMAEETDVGVAVWIDGSGPGDGGGSPPTVGQLWPRGDWI